MMQRSILPLFIFGLAGIGPAQSATVLAPEVSILTIGSDTLGHYGVHLANGAAPFGMFSQASGTTTANNGDDLVVTITAGAGNQFRLDTTGLNRVVFNVSFEQFNPRFGGDIFRNGLGSVAFNGVQGGTAPSVEPIVNTNNAPFVMGPENTPTGFYGQIAGFATHSNGQPVTFGSGVITFDSVTMTIPNVADFNWEEQPLDQFSFYFGNESNTAPISIVPVPEPSSPLLLGLSSLGMAFRRSRR